MARTIQISQSIAATSTVADVIAAQGINNVFGRASTVVVYWNQNTATAMSAALSVDDGTTATGLVPAGSSISAASTSGKIKTNEDFVGQFAVPANSKLLLSVTNPTAGALTFNALVVIS